MTIAKLRKDLEAIQQLLDRAKALAADLEVPDAPTPPPAAVAPVALRNPPAFFDAMRGMSPTKKLTKVQVDGLEAILAACAADALPLAWAAYVIATPALETGMSFDPGKVESLNYSVDALISKFSRERISIADARRYGRNDATGQKANQEAIANCIYGGSWGLKNLGNTQPGDGWWFRGRSWPQLTGRRNFTKADAALKLNGALLTDPSILARVEIAAPVLVRGMEEGWYTTKALSDYLPVEGRATRKQFTAARWIVNGQDRAEDIADYALQVQDGLTAGGYA